MRLLLHENFLHEENEADMQQQAIAAAFDADIVNAEDPNEIKNALNNLYAEAITEKQDYANKYNAWKNKHAEQFKEYEKDLQEYKEWDLPQWEYDKETYEEEKRNYFKNAAEARKNGSPMPEKPVAPGPKPEPPVEPKLSDEPKEHGAFVSNLLFEGEAGAGKSSIVTAWAREKGLICLHLMVTDLSKDDFQITVYEPSSDHVHKVGTDEYNVLDDPNKPGIIIIDELNRGDSRVINSIYQLLAAHEIYDDKSPTKTKTLKGLLFVVACQNPHNARYSATKELDSATLERFIKIPVKSNKITTLKYYRYDLFAPDENDSPERAKKKARKFSIAKKILMSPNFSFDTTEELDKLDDEYPENGWNNKATNARSFTYLLLSTDGTKEAILNSWNKFCNNQSEDIIEQILLDYKDVDDIQNTIWANRRDLPTNKPVEDNSKEAPAEEERILSAKEKLMAARKRAEEQRKLQSENN